VYDGEDMPYKIEFAKTVKGHFKYLSVSQRTILLDAIEEQLTHEPLRETRNRKPLRPNPIAPWELRSGDLRVFYEPGIGSDDREIIKILAVGIKQGNRLVIGGKVVEL
jgi:mRNA-degrading endonuclease RelE of RelBE toxin-antitoxin system